MDQAAQVSVLVGEVGLLPAPSVDHEAPPPAAEGGRPGGVRDPTAGPAPGLTGVGRGPRVLHRVFSAPLPRDGEPVRALHRETARARPVC